MEFGEPFLFCELGVGGVAGGECEAKGVELAEGEGDDETAARAWARVLIIVAREPNKASSTDDEGACGGKEEEKCEVRVGNETGG